MDIRFKKSIFFSTLLAVAVISQSSFAQLTNPLISNDQKNIYFSFTENTPFSFYQVFVDSDMLPSTGYSIGGIGADRLIENSTAYKNNGTGWNWTTIQQVTFTNSKNVLSWSVPLSILGAPLTCATPINIIYRGTNSSGPNDVTGVLNYQLNIGTQCISSASATANATQFIFQYAAALPETNFRVYIDTDQNANTGFSQGGIGAEYLLEGNSLYSYVGPGWNWKFIKNISFTQTGNMQEWQLNRADVNLNCDGALNYLFQVENNGTNANPSSATLNYSSNTSCTNPVAQAIAVPSYFYPDCATNANCNWGQLDASIPPVGVAVINPNNGPGASLDTNYAKQVVTSHALGAMVLGYVYTNYGARPIAAVEQDISQYYTWYNVDGIFLDEGYSSSCSMASYYQTLNSFVKSKGGKGLTVVNYGTNTPSCYANSSDILLTFESDYNSYLAYQVDAWTNSYPASKFWHIIYNATQANMPNAISLSKQRRAGYVYVTPLNLPNPYSAMPPIAYWKLEVGAVNQ